MNYSKIETLLKTHIDNQTSLKSGMAELGILLKNLVGVELPKSIDFNRLEHEFRTGIMSVLKKNKPSNSIHALYFGLTTIAGPNATEQTSIHINGSKVSPEDDEEWACSVDFRDDTYLTLKDFDLIDDVLTDELDDKGAAEVIAFNGLLNLLLINSIKTIKELMFNSGGFFSKPREVLWIGAGYDSGDCYVISKIEK